MTKYRLKYCKESGMRFISHLDLLKMFSRAARRCRLPLSYSQGFNPHPELVFNAPLPLGVTSEAEYVDLSLDEELPEAECLSRLASVLPEGIRPLSVRKLDSKEATVMKYVCACQYRLTVCVQGIAPNDFVTEIQKKLALEEPILIMKKSKSGIKETDIRPLIRAFFENTEIQDTLLTFTCITAAGNIMNLRPEVALTGLSQVVFGDSVALDIQGIHKIRYYTEDGGTPD